jgi:hypothetical protein
MFSLAIGGIPSKMGCLQGYIARELQYTCPIFRSSNNGFDKAEVVCGSQHPPTLAHMFVIRAGIKMPIVAISNDDSGS